MKKKFKTKKHIKIKYKNIVLTLIGTILLIITLKFMLTIKILKINIIDTIKYSNIYEYQDIKNKIKKITQSILRIEINNPTTIIETIMPYKQEKKQLNNQFYTIKNETHEQKNEEPQIYIYNTHQTEQYIGNEITPTPTVLTASYYLKDKLEKEGIKTIVEETSIPEILKNNNWNYNQSYEASKINLQKIKQQYPNIKIYIDLHRDAVSKNLSTVTIDGKEYAKVLFVIGKEHKNYEKNLQYTKSINGIIERNYPALTKGILQKEGKGVNGIYNQDLGENIILIEVGANENTIEEVTNTLDIITMVIKEKINEK